MRIDVSSSGVHPQPNGDGRPPRGSRSLENPAQPLDPWSQALSETLEGSLASSGIRVSRDKALTAGAYWRGITLVSRSVAKLPLRIQRRAHPGWEDDDSHPADRLGCLQPNEAMTPLVWKQLMMHHALTRGNGYSYIVRRTDTSPLELWPLDPDRTYPARVNGQLMYVHELGTGETRKIDPRDMLHWKGLGWDGMRGYDVLAVMREVLGGALGTQRYGSVFFRNSARPNVILKHPGKLGNEARRNVRESWERIAGGLDNSHKTMVLEEGMDAIPLQINAHDAQLIESREFSLIDFANFLGVPPHKLGSAANVSYKSLEQENQAYLDDTLDPWLVMIEEEHAAKLLTVPQRARGTHRAHCDRRSLVRADRAALGAYYTQALAGGWMNQDEIRAREGDNPIPGGLGQTYYRPATLVPLAAEEPGTAAIAGELLDLPDLRQESDYDCGPAAVMAVCHFFGVGPEGRALYAEGLGTTKAGGTRPAAILDFLGRQGLVTTSAVGLEVEDLLRFFRAGQPVLVPFQAGGEGEATTGHWGVVIGVALGQVMLHDPAQGRRMLAEDDFLARWHDADSTGQGYEQYGIAVGEELLPEAKEPEEGEEEEQPGQPGQKSPAKDAARSAHLTRCGGPGSGVPGPCPEGGGKGGRPAGPNDNEALPPASRPDLTVAEARAVRTYTDEAYDTINAALRAGEALSGKDAETDKLLQGALAKAGEFAEPVSVYRAMGIPPGPGREEFLGRLRDAAASGAPVGMGGGYLSTTTSRAAAENMGKSLLVRIDARSGLDAAGLSKHPKEKELLMDRDSRFRVQAVTKGGSNDEHDWEVHLEHLPAGSAARAAPMPGPRAAQARDDGEIDPARAGRYSDVGPDDVRVVEDGQEGEKKKPLTPDGQRSEARYSDDQPRDPDGKFASGGGGDSGDAGSTAGSSSPSPEPAKPAEPASSGDRPARPAGGFKTDAEAAAHGADMVKAHEADPKVQALQKADAKAQKDLAKAQKELAAASKLEGAAGYGATRQATLGLEKAQGAADKAQGAVEHASRESFLKSFGTPKDQQPNIGARNIPGAGTAQRGAAFVAAATFIGAASTKEAIGDQKVNLAHALGGRAFYSTAAGGTISTTPEDGPTVTAHEFGHHLEEQSRVLERTQAFSKERFGDEKPRDLAKEFPQAGFRPDGAELGRSDDFEKLYAGRSPNAKKEAAYVGKTYKDGTGEVASMGVEQLYRDPVHMAKTDPGFFALTVGILQRK